MQTSAAQTGTNIGTAIANNTMGMVNQITPDGSLTYSQSGTYKYKDPYTGQEYDLPTYTATTALSEMGQQIKGQNDQTQLNLAETGAQQSGFLNDYLGEIWNPDTSAIEGRLMELGSQRLDPRFAQQEDQLRTRLANQGVTAGSEAWNREMQSLNQSKNDAYNQLMLQGRGQAFSELQAQRNQPINEITALLSGSQVSNPATASPAAPQAGVAGVDYAGLVGDKYRADLAASQAKMGGLFGLASSGIGLFSDERLKTDIRRVGQTDGGLPVYVYRYGGRGPYHMGVMAQEAAAVVPDAIGNAGGFMTVDYARIR